MTGTFRRVAESFSNVSDFMFDVVVTHFDGYMAYSVGYERCNGSTDGGPIEPIAIRVTHAYRREGGVWKIVHRHGDFAPEDQQPTPPR